MAKIIVNIDTQYVGQFDLPEGRSYSIGRSPKCNLQLDSPAISGLHAFIGMKNGHYFIEDKDSTNGTMLNERRIGHMTLKDGDTIIIGKYRIKFWSQISSGLDDHESTVVLDDAEKARAEINDRRQKEAKAKQDAIKYVPTDELEFNAPAPPKKPKSR